MKKTRQFVIFAGIVSLMLIYIQDEKKYQFDSLIQNQPGAIRSIGRAEPKRTAQKELKTQVVKKSYEKSSWQEREELESRFRSLNEIEIKSQIQKFDFLLAKFSQLNFSEMSREKREDFNRLNRLRLFALQRLIMLKHGDLL